MLPLLRLALPEREEHLVSRRLAATSMRSATRITPLCWVVECADNVLFGTKVGSSLLSWIWCLHRQLKDLDNCVSSILLTSSVWMACKGTSFREKAHSTSIISKFWIVPNIEFSFSNSVQCNAPLRKTQARCSSSHDVCKAASTHEKSVHIAQSSHILPCRSWPSTIPILWTPRRTWSWPTAQRLSWALTYNTHCLPPLLENRGHRQCWGPRKKTCSGELCTSATLVMRIQHCSVQILFIWTTQTCTGYPSTCHVALLTVDSASGVKGLTGFHESARSSVHTILGRSFLCYIYMLNWFAAPAMNGFGLAL